MIKAPDSAITEKRRTGQVIRRTLGRTLQASGEHGEGEDRRGGEEGNGQVIPAGKG